jgi:hypothetical protein
MARGNGTVSKTYTSKLIRFPDELILIAKVYQESRRLPSFNAAAIELIEHSLREWAMNEPPFPGDPLDIPVMVPL